MTVRGAFASRTGASGGVVRWTRVAVVALVAAFAVLVHHETAAAAMASPSSATHVMSGMPGMAVADSSIGQGRSTEDMGRPAHAHGHGSGAAQAAEPPSAAPTTADTNGPACSGMVMQHCSTASFETVNLPAPTASWVPRGLAPYETVTGGSKAAGSVGRAPPDLSLLSQLRI
ncbi:hypothetical protein STRIP9103_09310 [Streptomyces ipomoeae 91-03]|jgi:hypothetical protein|uniref:Uncharacterized protein n=1 Tax=Streptomyces ipomoeae 91-03 TaxID=698759 RepID=L1L3D2_9ACTN|nr:hypothetical protein STRIP9103_09310 [Streptomyces ipomoeae 91-03]